jgi:hypothetical protein
MTCIKFQWGDISSDHSIHAPQEWVKNKHNKKKNIYKKQKIQIKIKPNERFNLKLVYMI